MIRAVALAIALYFCLISLETLFFMLFLWMFSTKTCFFCRSSGSSNQDKKVGTLRSLDFCWLKADRSIALCAHCIGDLLEACDVCTLDVVDAAIGLLSFADAGVVDVDHDLVEFCIDLLS